MKILHYFFLFKRTYGIQVKDAVWGGTGLVAQRTEEGRCAQLGGGGLSFPPLGGHPGLMGIRLTSRVTLLLGVGIQ